MERKSYRACDLKILKGKRTMNIILSLVSLWLAICLVVSPSRSLAQSTPPSSAGSSSVNTPAKRGEALFLQRCSICHLAKSLRKPQPSFGPSLNGLFKNAKPDQEKIVREGIVKGTPNMPGFQYGLEAAQIDDLIAYLKSL